MSGWEPNGMRIIPARAGFTCVARSHGSETTDHPRSRGVYDTLTLEGVLDAGSSPLARGLPQVLVRRERGRRIIPARAGFMADIKQDCIPGLCQVEVAGSMV